MSYEKFELEHKHKSKDALLRMAYAWALQAHGIHGALTQCQESVITLFAFCDSLVGTLNEVNAIDRIDPKAVQVYRKMRSAEIVHGTAIERVAMEEHARLAVSENYANKGKAAGRLSAASRTDEVRNASIRDAAAKLIDAGKSSRDLASILAQKYSLSTTQVRRIIAKSKK